MKDREIRELYEDEIGRGYPNQEKMDKEMAVLSEQLGVAPDGIQFVDLKKWADQNKRFEEQTRRMVRDLKRRGLVE